MEDSHAGWQTYLILEEQAPGQCPIRDPVTDANGNIRNMNGVCFISALYLAPNNNWANFIAAFPNIVSWVFDVDTGQGRFYNNPGGVLATYWDPEKRALGKIQGLDISNRRPTEEIPEIGEMYVADIKSQRFSAVNFTIRKLSIDKRKLAAMSRTSLVVNQAGFRGDGVISVPEYIATLKSNWYLLIEYIVDKDSDAANFARGRLLPCVKFSEIAIVDNTEETLKLTLTGKGTYLRPIPEDESNVETYTQANAPT